MSSELAADAAHAEVCVPNSDGVTTTQAMERGVNPVSRSSQV